MRNEAISIAVLVALYAATGTPLAAYAATIRQAIERAVQVRYRSIPAPGKWQTDRDGEAIPDRGMSVIHIGGNGPCPSV